MAANVQRETRIIIVGAGLIGLATAIGLHNSQFQVIVLERVGEFSKNSAGIAIPPNATNALRTLGVLDEIEQAALQPDHFHVRSYGDGGILASETYIPRMRDTYKTSFLNSHRATFHSILLKKAIKLGIKIRLGVNVSKIDFETPSVHLDDGEVLYSDMVLGADGQDSLSRQLMLGRPDRPISAGDAVFAIDIAQSEMMEHEELRDLVDPPCINLWFGPCAHVVVFALREDGLVHIIGSRTANLEEPIRARPQPVDLAELRQYLAKWDPRIRKIFDIAQSGLKWTLTETPYLTQWAHADGKFALIGDAAHAMLPFFAQGAAQGVEDATVLTQLFSRLTHKDQIPDLLTIYADLRIPRALRIKQKAQEMRLFMTMPDGDQQQERDRQLKEYGNQPFGGYPLPWMDPDFADWIYSYDIENDVAQAFEKYAKGLWPKTRGGWRKLVQEQNGAPVNGH